MWRKETKRTKQVTPAQGASAEMLAMLLQEAGEDPEIEQSTPLPVQMMPDPMTGEPVQRVAAQLGVSRPMVWRW